MIVIFLFLCAAILPVAVIVVLVMLHKWYFAENRFSVERTFMPYVGAFTVPPAVLALLCIPGEGLSQLFRQFTEYGLLLSGCLLSAVMFTGWAVINLMGRQPSSRFMRSWMVLIVLWVFPLSIYVFCSFFL